DDFKAGARPWMPARTMPLPLLATLAARRRQPRYRRHRQEVLDSKIRQQARVRQLEAGLAIILERESDSWHRRELVAIADGAIAGLTATQIAQTLGISTSTVERRLAEIRNAPVAAEAKKQLAGPCPLPGQSEGLGTKIPLHIEG